jgi:hypothetical protein
MIHVLKEKAALAQIQEMLKEYDNMIKIVVDIRKQVESVTREILGGVK